MTELWRRLLFLFRRRQFESELEEEMRFHLEMKSQEIGTAAARRQFGNAARIEVQVENDRYRVTLSLPCGAKR